jgi:hypothetical protein
MKAAALPACSSFILSVHDGMLKKTTLQIVLPYFSGADDAHH